MGKSSPIVTGERIFVTAHEGQQLVTIGLDKETGTELWRRSIRRDRLEKMHHLNDEATATPTTDGDRVFSFFEGYGLICYSLGGDELWKVRMGPFSNFQGMGASPVYADGKVMMAVDQDRDAYIIAFNAADGSVAWKTDRPTALHGFSTPIVYRPEHGLAEVIMPGSYQMIGYALETGEELWRCMGLTYQVKSSPVIDGDTLYFNSFSNDTEPSVAGNLPSFDEAIAQWDTDGNGLLAKEEIPAPWTPNYFPMSDLNDDKFFDARDWEFFGRRSLSTSQAFALKLGGRGDISDTHMLWNVRRNLPNVPGVLSYEGSVYLIKNGGILTTVDATDGSVQKQARLGEAIDNYYASPVAGDGKVFVLSETGMVSVLRAGPEWEILSMVKLDDGGYATPALVDGRVYLRTDTRIYCFGD